MSDNRNDLAYIISKLFTQYSYKESISDSDISDIVDKLGDKLLWENERTEEFHRILKLLIHFVNGERTE